MTEPKLQVSQPGEDLGQGTKRACGTRTRRRLLMQAMAPVIIAKEDRGPSAEQQRNRLLRKRSLSQGVLNREHGSQTGSSAKEVILEMRAEADQHLLEHLGEWRLPKFKVSSARGNCDRSLAVASVERGKAGQVQ